MDSNLSYQNIIESLHLGKDNLYIFFNSAYKRPNPTFGHFCF